MHINQGQIKKTVKMQKKCFSITELRMPGLRTNRMPGAEEDQQRLSFLEEGQGLHCQGQSLEGRMSFLQEGNRMSVLLQDWSLPTQGWGKII